MNQIKLILWCALLCCPLMLKAQEFNCSVTVNASQVQGTERKIFETLQKSVVDFVNNRKWTNLNFQAHERIECSMTIIVQDRDAQSKVNTASISIQARRPVFNGTYNTVLLNVQDKDFSFKYDEFDQLEYSDNSIGSNLTATIAYYCYLILGLTFDSYAMEGGQIFFQKAQDIVSQALNFPQGMQAGWRPADKNQSNRYWTVESFLNGNYGAIHEVLYRYHRKGLDLLYDKADEGRLEIFKALDDLHKLNKKKPHIASKILFCEAKTDEIVNVFRVAQAEDRKRVAQIMIELDPVNAPKYKELEK